MDKLVVRGTEINVQWDIKRDDNNQTESKIVPFAKLKENLG